MRLTIDASVWISAHSPHESGHAESRALIDRILARGESLFEPMLFLIEVAGVVARTRSEALALGLTNALLSFSFINWVALDETLARSGRDIAAAGRLRGADAVYGAVAAAHNCVLVSLDQEQLTRLPPIVRTITPSEALALPAPTP